LNTFRKSGERQPKAQQSDFKAPAFLRGIERRIVAGLNPNVGSVASVFISRWDVSVADKVPDRLRDQLGIAIAQRTYKAASALLSSQRWRRVYNFGARPQRLLWASTGTKNPSYRDVLYIETLIGPDTVNTIPPATMDAFRDHGQVARTLDADVAAADQTMSELASVSISMQEVTDKLLVDAIKLFDDAFTQLLAAIDLKKNKQAKP